MSRAFCLVGLLAIAAAVPATASAKGFSRGVASAEVTSNSALLWTRADKTGKLTLTVARDKELHRDAKNFKLKAAKGSGQHGATQGRGAEAGYDVLLPFSRKGASSDRGTFRTAPKTSSTKPVRFAWTGDSDPVLDPSTKKLHFGPFDVFARMAGEATRSTSTSATRSTPTPTRVSRPGPAGARRSPRSARSTGRCSPPPTCGRLRAAAGMYNQWDDHEFLNDFAIDQTRYPTVSGTQEGRTRGAS